MHSRHPHLLLSSLVLLALPLQSIRGQRPTAAPPDSETEVRANGFDQRAEQLERSDMTRLREASALRLRATALRRPDDLRAAASLHMAGLDRYYSGQRRAGRELFLRAADRALGVGDVVLATKSLTDALYVSLELKERKRARALLRRAQLLTVSPLLSDDQRRELAFLLYPPSSGSRALSAGAPPRAGSGDTARSP